MGRSPISKIIKIQGAYQLPEAINQSDISGRFDYIYNSGLWLHSSQGESRSGVGNSKKNTMLYRDQLAQYLDAIAKSKNGRKIKFFDAPCGDLNWIMEIFDKVKYSGGDISESLISDLNKRFPDIDTRVFNVIEDEFPSADIWHARDCLFHLSLCDISKSLENFCNSNIETAIITNHFLADSVTFDIESGSFRFLDLTNFPYYLSQPKLWLLDTDPRSGKTAKASGVWTKEQIRIGVNNYHNLT